MKRVISKILTIIIFVFVLTVSNLAKASVTSFTNDTKVCSIPDENMFDSAFLVSPVTHSMINQENGNQIQDIRKVYLPEETTWFDFWTGNDARRELIIGKRQSSFPGMLNDRTFKIILVSPTKGTGVSIAKNPDKTVQYNGNEQTIKL